MAGPEGRENGVRVNGGEKAVHFPHFYSGSANTDFGDEAFHRRVEMTLKSRELKSLGDPGLSFWRPFTQVGHRGREEGNEMFRPNRALGSIVQRIFPFPSKMWIPFP